MGFGVRTGFEISRMLPLAFTFRFLFVLPFRFIDLYSQIDADASKTSLCPKGVVVLPVSNLNVSLQLALVWRNDE